jgi:hypothetical protein
VNVLYLSCHEVLEYDELRMLSEIPGINVFSPGAYIDPRSGSKFRPPLPISYPEEWIDAWNTITPTPEKPNHKYHLTPESVEPFDVIIVMHHWPWLFENWNVIKDKKVIWRDIGQTNPGEENANIKEAKELGIKLVRYWHGYQDREFYQGCDAIIPFGKYSEDFPKWNGEKKSVVGLCQSIQERSEECRYDCWETSTKGFSRAMYGGGNDGLQCFGGNSDYTSLNHALSHYKAMWYGGTRPAPYTLGLMEAMFIGVPVFSVKDLGWETALPEMLSDFQLADGSEVLRERIHSAIVTDNALFGMVSRDQRNYAVSKWDASVIKPKWEAFLKNI